MWVRREGDRLSMPAPCWLPVTSVLGGRCEGPDTPPAAVVVGVKGEAGLGSVAISGAEAQAGGASSIPGSCGPEGLCEELGTSPGLRPRHARLLLCFLGQSMNQLQLLKIHTNTCALAAQCSEVCTHTLRNGWMVLGILFLTKSS